MNNDILRQENLESEGLIFLRFTNEQIETNLDFVIETINKYINHTGKPLEGFGVI
jgi:very-short-patch-repair endonuclease